MNVFIRTDASKDIGTGHVMRSLVLAEDLKKENVKVTFICRLLPGNLMGYIKKHGFNVLSLPTPEDVPLDYYNWFKNNWKKDVHQTIQTISDQYEIDWFIIDHYAIDKKWEQKIRPYVRKIMIIDDLANRSHDCDLLLDQNLYRDMRQRYIKLTPEKTTLLLGGRYFLLRREFRDITNMKRSTSVKRILISFGGSDPTNETMKALKAIKLLKRTDISVDVVIGVSNSNVATIKQFCEQTPHVNLYVQVNNISELMIKADIGIGAGGSTTWERCYVGLPTITIEVADNQKEILSYLSERGAVYHLGSSKGVQEKDIARVLEEIIKCPDKLREMSDTSKNIMKDYESGAVAKQLIKGE
ncbi:UDP-2,4-diacetamido-2,4,6-trideoxy-beta-L-altropyranose hydrolase [Oceanobacillus senegalensis]|uniref:UDP-2,4-diacetamido-2,4, 6-trideoxy-beta-L-altropyranose hydrolase n=1 Tax=Oceanobacillus senegalensis TaxID=1936063 RepID=UPI000A31330E|nr:UDP-2,4-diacetamido-2,4,6-trideoxy-beta-L-altropyranose hydrolase [Oceanobacillus senegalensis]